MEFKITHYVRRTSIQDGWARLGFVVRNADSFPEREFYQGFEMERPLSVETISSWEKLGSVKRLAREMPISRNQSPWIAPDGSVWLASSTDPNCDKNRILLDTNLGTGVAIAGESGADLEKSAVARIIRETKVLGWTKGRYCNSRRKPTEDYWPHWQQLAKSELISDLRSSFGSDLDVHHYQEQEHQWPYLRELIQEGALALPFEMIFRTKLRSRDAEVVQLANATDLSLLYVIEAGPYKELRFPHRKLFSQSDEWTRKLRESQIRFCTHIYTSADEFIWRIVNSNQLDTKLKDTRPLPEDLLNWISVNRQGVVICDVGVAYQILEMSKRPDHSALKLSDRVDFCLLRYPNPIPVGIAYMKEDESWGTYLRSIINEVLSSQEPDIKESRQEFEEMCSELGMTSSGEVLIR